MNLLSRGNGRELLANQHTAEPHSARRAIRHTAANNAQQAIARQFPGLFTQQVGKIAAAQPFSSTSQGGSHASQTAQ
jgi:hypothetical protein